MPGAPVVVDIALLDTAYFAVGGLITIVVNLLFTPPRRLGAVRSGIAHSYRELQDAAQRRGIELAAPTEDTRIDLPLQTVAPGALSLRQKTATIIGLAVASWGVVIGGVMLVI